MPPIPDPPQEKWPVRRLVSFGVLILILALIGFLFFQVMSQFMLPLFLALILAVVFRPLHEWILTRCRSYMRAAAAITTTLILIIVMLPSSWIVIQAGAEATSLVRSLDPDDLTQRFGKSMEGIRDAADRFGIEAPSDHEMASYVSKQLQELLTPLALGGVTFALKLLLGFIITIAALFYFLLDGPAMIEEMLRLSPLDVRYARQLVAQFGNVSRAVVMASLLAALIQGILAGAAFLVVGMPLAFLLISLTVLLSMIPFLGAAAVWIPSCLWLFFHEGRTGAAIGLALYCGLIVSLSDNLVKPLVLHGHSNLHPLLALLAVLGGVTALGPIGILVGPLAVSFLQALLVMLRTELDDLGEPKSLLRGKRGAKEA